MRVPYTLATVVPVALLLTGCFGAKKNVEDYVQRAQAYEASGDLTQATKELRSALKISPLHAQANAMLGKIEDDQGNLQEAINRYIVASRADAGLLRPQLRLIELMIDADHLQEALAKANTTLGAFPNNIDALALRADIEQRQGSTVAASTDTAAVLSKDPNNARALAVSAIARVGTKDLQGAMALVDRGLAAHPDSVHLLEVRAAIQLNQNSPEQAVDTLKAIVKAEPGNVAAHSVLASAEAQSGHFEEGLNHLKEAAAAEPNNDRLQLALISFLAQRGKQADVVAELKDMIARNPRISTYDRTLAEYYRGQGRLSDAEQTLQAALVRLQGTPAARDVGVALAKLAILSNQFAAAGKRLEDVLSTDPNNVDALMTSAILAGKNGRLNDAIATLLTVVKLSPVNAQAFQLLASDYMGSGQPGLAVSAMQRAAAVSPGDIDLQLRFAAMLQAAGQRQMQNELLTRLTLQAPNLAGPWLAMGDLAIERQDLASADRALTRLQAQPNSKAAAARLDADLQAARGNYAAATTSYLTAVQGLGDPDTALLGTLVEAATKAGSAQTAAQVLEKRAGAQNSMVLWIAAMDLWANARDASKAEAAFSKATASSPGALAPYEAYAAILLRQKAFDQAKAMLAAGQGKVPDWSLALLQGTVAEQQGALDAAAGFYEKAASLNPNSARAVNNYASLLADLKPQDKPALEAARAKLAGLETSPDPSVVDTIAWLDFRLGRFEEARQLLTQIKAGESKNPQIRFHLAATLLVSGDRAGGLALLESVKGQTFPGSDEIQRLSAT